jgi:hypothetical protein
VSYRALARYAGKASDATIAKALQQFKQLGILEALPKTRGNFRDAGRYRFTLDSPKFQRALSEIHERFKLERNAERELRAQSKIPALQKPKPMEGEEAGYLSTSTLYSNCSVSEVDTSLRCSVKQETDSPPNEEKEPFFEHAGIDNKEGYASAHYTLVKCEDEKEPNKKLAFIPSACENSEEQSPIPDGAQTENKTTYTSAHFSTVKCEESEPAEVTPLVTSQESENPPARWKAPTSAGLSEIELAEKIARSIATARQWSEITGERSR